MRLVRALSVKVTLAKKKTFFENSKPSSSVDEKEKKEIIKHIYI